MQRRDFLTKSILGSAALIGLPSVLSAKHIVQHTNEFYVGQIVELLYEYTPIPEKHRHPSKHATISKGTLMTISKIQGNIITCDNVISVYYGGMSDNSHISYNGVLWSVSVTLDKSQFKPYTEGIILLPGQRVKLLKPYPIYDRDFKYVGEFEVGTIASIYTTKVFRCRDKVNMYVGYGLQAEFMQATGDRSSVVFPVPIVREANHIWDKTKDIFEIV